MVDEYELRRRRVEWPVVGAVAVGGGVGALARYAAAQLWPTAEGAFPWTTFAVNMVGCAAIGLFLALLRPHAHPLLRPFVATGILGGFTTFSTYAVDAAGLVRADRAAVAAAYLLLTLLAALLAARAGIAAGDRIRAAEARP
ncbi:fluoride efflux transporter CrcB [Streptomyces sp. NPDC060194]|uniref:fluoride efflux transporter CrcB n=1 Tax=Streptomyces sp. NPDC060194 TaxID=3347069 RepID=UPI003662E405